ncbi:YjbF family lipoprotein [Pseudaeromonas sharmana]|uniref:YjbF family lipoprotein n=1 Tax=Pseudaeromonas sharmana TaxID=328412 RepID=A0ABV8CSD0_9GAMM
MKTPLSLLLVVLLSACSQQSKLYVDTIKEVTLGSSDVVKTAAEIDKDPYASAYLTVGDLPRAFVLLAFAERGQMKWISADRNLFVMQQGRLIKTVGQREDLLALDNLAQDPLQDPLAIPEAGARWQTRAYYSGAMNSGRLLISTLYRRGNEVLTILDKPVSCVRIEEEVTDQQSGQRWRNDYWVDAQTKLVMASRQQTGSQLPSIEFTLLKPL